MTTLVAINPHSRRGGDVGESLDTELKKLGPLKRFDFDGEASLADTIGSLGDRLDQVVIGGGDGTLNAALGAVREVGVPLGVLPLGTANDFARSMGIPDDPAAALDVIRAGHRRRIDLGEANGRLFLNAIGVGLGPRLNQALDEDSKRKFGVMAYGKRFLELVGDRYARSAVLTIDGVRRRTRYMQITIGNGIHYGGGMTLSTDAALDDGKLRVLCLQPQTFTDLCLKLVTLRWGADPEAPEQSGMRLFQAEQVEVHTRRPKDVTGDGELLTQTPLSCRIIPEAIEVFAPESGQNGFFDALNGLAGDAREKSLSGTGG